ncbi:hypothetical protein TanjilG_10864 [Lupinus angustifolius]|uniref:Uncharacterized protein n=1 Tax=Lupinus angustifolius TaxID=3871 RepID=A0A1J7GZR4_LUPAN|nr:hypothetical protein TanjilG_10864 [Lupinus angustifolius]
MIDNKKLDFPIWDCGSPLYDSHELVSLAYAIERHMITWPSIIGPNPFITTQFFETHEAKVSTKSSVTKGSSMVTTFSEILVKNSLKKKLNPLKKKKKDKRRRTLFYELFCGGN